MEAGNDSASADAAATAAPAEAAQAVPAQAPTPTPWFNDWAASKGIDQFSRLLGDAGLTTFVESCETPLTIFAPTNEAIMGLGSTLPTDTQLLRELLCVHITMGSLSREELLSTRSITTIGQQTHHVQVHEAPEGAQQPLQVGTMTLVVTDITLPGGHGVLHVVDCVMCCLRLLHHCRYEQVWNKTVRPAPKVGLQGDWKPVDELHAVLVHCDTWTPRFSGLRGNVVPLGPVMAGQDHRAARHFQDGVVTYSELLILEKPPEMSKKKRKKTEDGEDYAANATPHYRMMFSLYRRDSNAPPPPPVPNPDGTMSEPQPDGKHLTFCMAPEDILIRNSFHMLTEGEKDARRAEYKSKQLTPKTGGSAVDVEAEYPSPAPGMYGSVAAVQGVAALPPLTVEALKSQAGGSDHERIIKLEGISPGMCGGAMALLPDAPLLSALSTTSGAYAGGTSVWIQGSRFNTRTRVYVAGVAVPRIQVVSDGLITLHTPPSAPGIATVEVRATNDGCAWSNALHFTYIASEAGASSSTDNQPSTDDSSPDALALAHRQATLLQSLVNTCCAKGNPASENMVSELMAPELSHTSRMFGASVLLLLSGLQSTAAAEFSRQDANGCTLVHYACSSRNLPALQLLLNSGADATTADATGSTPLDWAARYAWVEGQQALCTATGQPAPTATPAAPMGAASSMPIAVPEAGATVAEAAVPSNGTAVAAGTPPLVAGAVAGAHPSAMRSLGQFIDPAQQQQQQQAGVEGGDGLGLFAAAAASVNSAQPQA